MVLFGSLIYFAEKGTYDESSGKYMRVALNGRLEESPFSSIPISFWYHLFSHPPSCHLSSLCCCFSVALYACLGSETAFGLLDPSIRLERTWYVRLPPSKRARVGGMHPSERVLTLAPEEYSFCLGGLLQAEVVCDVSGFSQSRDVMHDIG